MLLLLSTYIPIFFRTLIYIFLFLSSTYIIYDTFHKQIYLFVLKHFITPASAKENKYFIDHFDNIISPFFQGDIPITNKSVNINRNVINEYSLNNKINTKDLQLHNPSNQTIDILLKRIIPFLNIDGKPVSYDDFIVLDVISTTGSYFPSFHTDVEWRSFYDNNGFQVWILLDHDPDIKPRGNMFIMETDIAEPGLSLHINDKNLNVLNNNSNDKKIIKSYKSLHDINPTIKYLNPNIGNVFIMNPSLFHCSDPANIFSNRYAINMRFLYKTSPNIKLGDLSNPYSALIRSKHFPTHIGNHCEFNFNNSDNRYKFK
jgi:hypothetical protein